MLSGKYIPAKLPQTCAPRYALINLFGRESKKRIIYVSAPAGYGKTISTQLWLKSSDRVPLWMALDEYDNTPSIFYKLLCTGMLSLQPKNKIMAEILASSSFASSPVEHTIRLLSEFVPDNRQYAIVLDDMHLVNNKEIRESGLLVEKRLPSSFVVVILTRNKIAEEYIAITGEERCAIITGSDLAFTAEEIQRHLMEHGHCIAAQEAQEAHALTDGWPIAVNAMAMSGQTRFDQNGAHILEHYIKTYIWDKWSKDLKEFSLKTAMVDEMRAELCRLLTGREDSRDLLERLWGANSFVTKISEDKYRYHHLFSEFLRGQALRSQMDTEKIYREAAKYHLDQGEYFAARRYAIKGRNMEVLMAVLHHFSKYRSACVEEFADFAKAHANDLPPESACDKAPFLYSTQMWESYLLGNAARMECLMDKVYRFLPAIEANFPQYMETVMMLITLDHRVPLSVQLERFPFSSLTPYLHEGQQGATLTHEMPFLHRSNRDYSELSDAGAREKLRACCGQLFKGSVDTFLSGIESGLLLEKNQIKEAMAAAIKTGALEDGRTSDELCFALSIHVAEAHYAAGDPKWNGIVKKIESFIEEKGAHYLMPNFLAYRARALLWNADKPTARSWFENGFVANAGHLELYKIFQHFTTARAHIVLSETDKAMSHILKLKKLGMDFNRQIDIAEATVLQAVLEWALGKKKEAVDTLVPALVSMQGYGFVRVFANEGASILPILKRLMVNLRKESDQGSLDALFLNRVLIVAYEESKRHRGIAANIRAQKPVKLSKQQKYVITLLAKGYRNTEIVGLTGLTIHTVKSHCAAAYKKLEVNSAMDAVVKARELRLIE